MPWTPLDWRASAPGSNVLAVPRGHAHNDYEQDRPLLDALDNGMASVGVDVFFQSGELRVAHEANATVPGRTLTSLYLDQPRLLELDQLMIDMKVSAGFTAEQVFAEIVAVVSAHPATSGGALPIIVSGTSPYPTTEVPYPPWIQFDGSYSNVWFVFDRATNPCITSPWDTYIGWDGTGKMPLVAEQVLWSMSAKCFENGRQMRFYGNADLPSIWYQMRRAGIDWISADDLPALAAWRASL